MRTEIPVCKRCCFCLPLRYGLLAWTYIKLIVDLLLIIHILFQLYFTTNMYRGVHYSPHLIPAITTLFIFGIDTALSSVFIVGAHKKDVRFMRAYYIYSIVLWVLTTLLVILGIVAFTYDYINYLLLILLIFAPHLAMVFIYLVIQTYFILLIRSEIVKLNNSANFQFVNHAAEAKCSLKMDYDGEHDNDELIDDSEAEEDDEITECENINQTCGNKTCCKVSMNDEKPT